MRLTEVLVTDNLRTRIITQGDRLSNIPKSPTTQTDLYQSFLWTLEQIKQSTLEGEKVITSVRDFSNLSLLVGRGEAVEIFSRKNNH